MKKLNKEYYKSFEWEELRQEVIDRELGTCEECGMDDIHHIHHKTYKRFGNEKLSDLQGLCETCHKEKHGLEPWEEFEDW